METSPASLKMENTTEHFNFGHLGAVVAVVVLLLGVSWFKDPNLFQFHNNTTTSVADSSTPHYYAYVPPAEDRQPQVLGASTQDQGPVVINDDGSVTPVDMGEVLGASTQGVQLSVDSIAVRTVPDSDAAIKKYFSDAQSAEGNPVNSTNFASALNSGDQNQINAQAQKLAASVEGLQKISVPQSLAKLHKLKIIQYNSAIQLLQNFTTANQNPEAVSQELEQFLKSQQDLDTENQSVAQKFPALDPLSDAYAAQGGSIAGASTGAVTGGSLSSVVTDNSNPSNESN